MSGEQGQRAHVVEVLHAAAATHEATAGACLDEVVAAAELLTRALAAGGKVLAFGNGGSAAGAQHLVPSWWDGTRRAGNGGRSRRWHSRPTRAW